MRWIWWLSCWHPNVFELTLGRRSRRKLSTTYRIIHFYTGSWQNDIARENCNGVQDSQISMYWRNYPLSLHIDLSFEQNGNCITEMQQISIGRPLTAIYAWIPGRFGIVDTCIVAPKLFSDHVIYFRSWRHEAVSVFYCCTHQMYRGSSLIWLTKLKPVHLEYRLQIIT